MIDLRPRCPSCHSCLRPKPRCGRGRRARPPSYQYGWHGSFYCGFCGTRVSMGRAVTRDLGSGEWIPWLKPELETLRKQAKEGRPLRLEVQSVHASISRLINHHGS